MVALMMLTIGSCVVVFAGGLFALAALFRMQVRRYDRVVSAELLDDWHARLQLLDPAESERAALSPPANVLAAMVSLPGRGLRGDWNTGPVFDGRNG